MDSQIEVLDETLRNWEDFCLYQEAADFALKGKSTDPYPKKWRVFRNYLLNYTAGPISRDFFCGMDNSQTEGEGGVFLTLPLQLLCWTAHSRRIFSIGKNMLNEFIFASYDGLRWGDLLWPFDSFLLHFENESFGNHAGLLVSRPKEFVRDLVPNVLDMIQCRPLLRSSERPMTFTDRQSFKELLRSGNRNKLVKKISKLVRNPEEFPFVGMGSLEPIQFLPEGDIAQTLQAMPPPVQTQLKILIGLCLYLERLPPQVVENEPWRQYTPKSREVRGLITDKAEVCHVKNFHTISPTTLHEALEKSNWPARSVTPHWRRAHYRRPKGKGNDPTAPRTVLVQATMIHRDKVPAGALVGGAVSKLVSE